MKKLFFGLIAFIWFINACAPTTTNAPIAATPNASATLSPLPTATATQTPLPSSTPTASITPLPTIPTFTPTFDARTIVTVTPALRAECPKISQDINLDFDINPDFLEEVGIVNQKILDFLNKGGSPEFIVDRIKSQYYSFDSTHLEWHFLEKDVTGDGVPELLIAPGMYITIFGCDGGKYRILLSQTTESVQEMHFMTVTDANENSIPEIYIYITECFGGKCNRLMAFEWQDNDFKYIVLDSVFNSKNPEHYCDEINAPFNLRLRDIDQDGLAELSLVGQPLPWLDDFLFPYRNETRICKWNGQGFVFYRKEFSQPKYRFQALQDADTAALQGEYSRASDLYKETISNKGLEWWSIDRRINDFETIHASYFHEPTPTPNSSLAPDPAEYPSLAAYAYYRIVLLRLVQNHESDAITVYNTLQQKFGSDPYGHPYVEMAAAFWEAYQSTHKIYDGCAAAIQYAAEHPEILTPLGSDYHGSQSHIYVTADVCPFR